MSPPTASTTNDRFTSLFQQALGEAWQNLPASVQRLHSGASHDHFTGAASISRGTSLIARLVAAMVGFPRAGSDIPAKITIVRDRRREVWTRDFAGRLFRSTLTPSRLPGHVRERFGVFTFELALPIENATLGFVVRRGWFLGLPMPVCCLPRSETHEFEQDRIFHFDVALYAPLGAGLIVRYRGWFRPKVVEKSNGI